MGLFRRKSRATAQTTQPAPEASPSPRDGSGDLTTGDVTAPEAAVAPGSGQAATPAAPAPRDPELGPFDRSGVDDDGGYVDLGAIWVPGIQGLMLTMEVDEASGEVTAVRVHLGESLLQLQAFAAPKSSGLWTEIRDELVAGVQGQGGACEAIDGRFGTEVVARIPAGPARDGRPAEQVMRFVGVDGPRWFLRGVLSGPAATDAAAAAPLLDLFALLVVVRGEEPMAPRELLPLRLPAEADQGAPTPEGTGDGAGTTDELRPFERGPEMTETR